MEKRIGVIAVLIAKRQSIPAVNSHLSEFYHIILGRQGLPLRDRDVSVISLIVEGTNDEIGALTGKIGRIDGVTVKSMLAKQ